MAVRLEHANLCVRDIDGMIRFLQTAFPEFQVRGEGRSHDGTRWVHIGADETYILKSDGVKHDKSHSSPSIRNMPLSPAQNEKAFGECL